MVGINLKEIKITEVCKPYIIAELGSNHNGINYRSGCSLCKISKIVFLLEKNMKTIIL
jgi:sialic acid synthase SpsE